jgi:CheY-like chemotaxis protein
MRKLIHKTILLVEDNEQELFEIKAWLGRVNKNHTLFTVNNCREALDLLNGNSPDHNRILPDVVLLNIYSPEMDGVEFLEIIKSYFSLRSIKVFFMIPGFIGDEKTVSQQFNIDGIISRPFRENMDENTVSLKKLEGHLTGSNSLKLHGLAFFPAFMSNIFSGLKEWTLSFLKSSFELMRPVISLKPLAMATVLLSTVIITTSVSQSKTMPLPEMRMVKAIKAAPVANSVVKTEDPKNIEPISKPEKNSVKPAAKSNLIDIVKPAPDMTVNEPAKEAPKPLKIVVIEEETEQAENVSGK